MKKMNGPLFAFILLLSVFSAPAQGPGFSWSRSEMKPAPRVDVRVLGTDAGGYYVLNTKAAGGGEFNPTLFLDYFTFGNERKFSTNITPASQYDYVDVLCLKGKVYLFSALFTKEAGKNVLLAFPIGSMGNPDKPVELQSIEADRLVNRGGFKTAVSPDGSQLLVLAQPEGKKGEVEKCTITIYTNELVKKSSSTPSLPYTYARGGSYQALINNEGTVFVARRVGGRGLDYSVAAFDGRSFREYKIELDGKKKTQVVREAFAPNGDLVAGGYYSEEGSFGVTTGTPYHGSYLLRVAHGGDRQLAFAINPFDKRKDLVLKNIVATDDRAIFLGEKYLMTDKGPQRDASNPMNVSNLERSYSFDGREIYVDGFDAAGKPLYATTIAKDNHSENDNGTMISFFSALVGNKLLVMFNDEEYKHDGKKHLVVAGGAMTKIPVLVQIDPATGAQQATTGLMNTGSVGGRKGDMYLRPDVFLRLDDRHFIIRGENRDTYKMGQVGFLN